MKFLKILKNASVLLSFIFVFSCASNGDIAKEIYDGLRNVGAPESVRNSIGLSDAQLVAKFGSPFRKIENGQNALFYYNFNMFYLNNGTVYDIVKLDSRRYNIDVESFSRESGQMELRSVAIVSGIKELDSKSLEFESYTATVKSLIRGSKNYKLANEGEIPDLLFVVNYGISDPITETKSYSTPVFSWQPNTVVNSTYYNSNGTFGSMSSTANDGGLRYHGENVTYYNETNYNRFFVITAVDAQKLIKEKNVHELWKVIISSYGPTGNLKNAVSAFSIASFELWGISVERNFKSIAFYNDPGPGFLK